MREVRRALGRLAALRRGFLERKRRKSDGDDVKHSQMSVLKAWWTWKRLGGGQLPEDENSEPPRKVRDIEAMAWKLRQEIEAGQSDIKGKIHGGRSRALMYSPGRVYHVDRLPPKLELERKKSLQARLDAGEDVPEEDEQIWGLYRVDHPENFFAMPWLEVSTGNIVPVLCHCQGLTLYTLACSKGRYGPITPAQTLFRCRREFIDGAAAKRSCGPS